MKPNELSELFNFSERKKYDIFKRDVRYNQLCNTDIERLCAVGAIALVHVDDLWPDMFPASYMAIITGYKFEDGNRKFIVRKLSDLSTSCEVTNAIPLSDNDKPVVLGSVGFAEPCICRVIGYSVSYDKLYVKVVGDEDEGIIGLPLEDFQTIKKDYNNGTNHKD